MAVGGPTSWSFEVVWDGVTPVDESVRLRASGEAVVITRGRGSEADDVQPGVLSAVLDNTDGARTPDNALSPLYPHVRDGAETRFSVTRGAHTSQRHRGELSVGRPEIPSGQPSRAFVAIESVDMLGSIAVRELRPDYEELYVNTAETATVDAFPFAGTIIENIGSGTGVATVIRAATGAGRYGTAAPDGGIFLESVGTVTASSSGVGPVIYCDTSIATGSVLTIEFSFRTADRSKPAGPSKWLAAGLSRFGAVLWSIRLVDNAGQCDVNLYDGSGGFVGTLLFGFSAIGADTGDDQWYAVRVIYSVGTQFFTVTRVVDNVSVAVLPAATINARDTRTVALGGRPPAVRETGAQTACVTASFGTLAFAAAERSHHPYLSPNVRTPAQTRFLDMNLFCNFGSSQFGTRNRPVWRKAAGGRTGFDVIAELTRTTGALVVAMRNGTGTLYFYDSDTQRLPTVALTVSAELDVDGTPGFAWSKGAEPSRVTATYPGGQVSYIDETRPRKDTTVDTCAADAVGALDVAAYRVNRSTRLRLTKLVIDLATAETDLWVAAMALEMGQRVRVLLGEPTSVLVRQYGVTWVDVFVVGSTEVYGRDVAVLELDTVPADDPVEGVWEDPERGRWSAGDTMTVTGGTAVGTTGLGTIVVTTTAGAPTWTTDATQYPLDVDWNSERVTVTSPPASAASPQTLTITARGVAPTVARIHAVGEPVDVWLGAAWTI